MVPKIFITLQEKQCRALSFPKTMNFRFMLVISVHERAGQTTVGDLEKMTWRQTNVNYFSFFPGSVSPIVSFCSGHPLSWEKVMFKQRMAVTSFSHQLWQRRVFRGATCAGSCYQTTVLWPILQTPWSLVDDIYTHHSPVSG